MVKLRVPNPVMENKTWVLLLQYLLSRVKKGHSSFMKLSTFRATFRFGQCRRQQLDLHFYSQQTNQFCLFPQTKIDVFCKSPWLSIPMLQCYLYSMHERWFVVPSWLHPIKFREWNEPRHAKIYSWPFVSHYCITLYFRQAKFSRV